MKTDNVKEIVECKFHEKSGNWYHNLVMSNGDKINIGKKKQLKVGDTLAYEIVDTQQEYNKAKTPQNTWKPKEKVFKADPVKQHSIEMQVCLKSAIDYLGTFDDDSEKPKYEQVVGLAKYFHEKLF